MTFSKSILALLFVHMLDNRLSGAHALSHSSSKSAPKHLVLVGGGHAHVQVIKALGQRNDEDVRVTLVDRESMACYSGMVPGCVANIYSVEETMIDLKALSKWSRIHFLQDEVVHIDLEKKGLRLKSEATPLTYDCISIDIGSTSRNLEIPGVREYAIPTRPIQSLVKKVQQAHQEAAMSDQTPHLAVVGGGIAGIELAMSICSHWRNTVDPNTTCTVFTVSKQILPGESQEARERLLEIARATGVSIQYQSQVHRVGPDFVELASGKRTRCTHCIWATGAAAHDLAKKLPMVTPKGWIPVNNFLQNPTYPFLFSAGDCAHLLGHPDTPKAGVYAVRAGPVLVQNIMAYMMGHDKADWSTYKAQDDFLKLIVCSHRKEALGLRWGLPFYGKWVFELKDAIDRQFLNLFDVTLLTPPDVNGEVSVNQYDSNANDETELLSPPEAAALLKGTNTVEIPYLRAWKVLRTMTSDPLYRKDVLDQAALETVI